MSVNYLLAGYDTINKNKRNLPSVDHLWQVKSKNKLQSLKELRGHFQFILRLVFEIWGEYKASNKGWNRLRA